MGLGHCDEILCGRITNTEKVCAGTGFRANAKVGSEEKRDFGFGFRQGQIRGPPTPSTLFSNQGGPLPNREMWCNFCNGPHPSNRCAVITDPETKKNILQKKGRCFGCLRSGHISKDCPARCYRCGGKHNLPLCSIQRQPIQFRQPCGATQEKTVSTNLYFHSGC